MLNRIVIINSELYAKAAIVLGDTNSVQLVAENNIGKSSFLNVLNFLYIPDKDKMRFEDNRTLSESMKHYFEDSSYSYILFEIFNNGYYCILVKATYEKTIEYYKINGEYQEHFFIETTKDGFKPQKWEKVLQTLTSENPTDVPQKLSNEDLYNLIYNSNSKKSPVVLINNKVRKGRGKSLSNSFTDIYKHLIKTSEITEKSFKSSLLVADNKQDTKLDIFSSSSSDKIEKLENQQAHINSLRAVKPQFEALKRLNDEFVAKESILGKIKNTFFKQYDKIALDLSNRVEENSPLSIEIKELETKINKTLQAERDNLIGKKTTAENRNEKLRDEDLAENIKLLEEVENYEPTEDDLMYNGLLNEVEQKNNKKRNLEYQVTQTEHFPFTQEQVEKQVSTLEKTKIPDLERRINDFDNLLYQNISDEKEIINKTYSYLGGKVANLDKSKIIKKITNADLPLLFFDGVINVDEVQIENPKTTKELQDELVVKKQELSNKKILLDAIKNKETLQKTIKTLAEEISKKNLFIEKVKNKPKLLLQKVNIEAEIKALNEIEIPNIENQIVKKNNEIKKERENLDIKKETKRQFSIKLKQYADQYSYFQSKTDIYEIEEIIDTPFENLYKEFTKHYDTFSGELGIRAQRRQLKDEIAKELKSDTQDIKKFIRDTEEEFNNLTESEKIIDTLLDSLSIEIGNPTADFLSYFNDFKTFVYRNYNAKLAEYPISNIQSVKVKIDENSDLINDLTNISNFKFSGGLNFDNSYDKSKEALSKQLEEQKGNPIKIEDLFNIKVEIVKVSGEKENIDLSKQVQSKGTSVVLKLYLFMNILKDLVAQTDDNKIVIYIDELASIGKKNIKHLVSFCREHNFVPIFAAPIKVEGIQKYYMIKEQISKISFGENQSLLVEYTNAE